MATEISRPASLLVDCFVDPICPWTWITSRWLLEVAMERSLEVRWRSFSPVVRDGGVSLSPQIPAELREVALAGRRLVGQVLQVFEAIRAERGEAAVGRLYSEFGRRLHSPGRPPMLPPNLLPDALQAAGLDLELEAVADHPVWQAAVKASTEEAMALVGSDAMSPVMVLAGSRPIGISGPMLSWVPTGDAAVRIWDAMWALAEEPAFGEARRARELPPRFPTLT
jgi:hypothetical protein